MRKITLSRFEELLVQASYIRFFNVLEDGTLLVLKSIDMCIDGMRVVSISPPNKNNINYGVNLWDRTIQYKPDEIATFSVIELIKKEVI